MRAVDIVRARRAIRVGGRPLKLDVRLHEFTSVPTGKKRQTLDDILLRVSEVMYPDKPPRVGHSRSRFGWRYSIA